MPLPATHTASGNLSVCWVLWVFEIQLLPSPQFGCSGVEVEEGVIHDKKLPNRSKPWARSRKSGNTTWRNPRVSWLVLACVCYFLPKSLMKTARLVYHGLWRNSDEQWLTYSVKKSLLIIATQNISICQSRKVPWGTTLFSNCKPPSPFLYWSIQSLPSQASKAERLALLIWRLASSNFRSPEFLLANFQEMSMCSNDLEQLHLKIVTFQTGSISRF